MAASLSIAKAEAETILTEHCGDGRLLVVEAENQTTSEEAYKDWNRRRRKWIELTKDALTYIYASGEEPDEFEKAARRAALFGPLAWHESLRYDLVATQRGVDKLESLIGRLRYATEPAEVIVVPTPSGSDGQVTEEPEIFLVHGRDLDKRDAVARFMERSGPPSFAPTILDEQAGKGRTIVEKLEQHAGDASYAVVLLTGDDEGRFGDAGETRPRARQNVILELGLFTGLLGRDNVAVLYEPLVEIPTDIGGLEYISLDGDWQKRLVRELRAAGWDFSLDRLDH
jgi:hypothetical protein